MTHRVDITRIRIGQSGPRYRVDYAGRVLVDSSRTPALDACRALLARGVTGLLETYQGGSAFASMRIDIERGAKLTVSEGQKIAPRFTRWAPFNSNVFVEAA